MLRYLALCALAACTVALNNGVALTPPRGLTTWELLNFNVSDAKLRALGEALVSSGLLAAGYDILWLDDGYPSCASFSGAPLASSCATPAPRAADGTIVPDPLKFPAGLQATVSYLHTLGLRVGIYTAPHATTCGGYTGSLGHEAVDARTFAAWGLDAVKLDAGCRDDASLHDGSLLVSLGRFRDALNATGRPIVVYIDDGNPISGAKAVNPLGRGVPSTALTRTHFARSFGELCVSWCAGYANMCKLWFDRSDHWGSLMDNVHQQANLAWFQGPGTFLAPDQMTLGQGALSPGEERAEVFLYAALAAPMFLSADPARLSPAQLALATNAEVLAVNSDADATMASQVSSEGGGIAGATADRWAVGVWVKPMSDGSFVFVLVNRDPSAARNGTICFGDGGTGSGADTFPAGAGLRARIRDLHTHTELGVFASTWSVLLPPHDAAIVRVFPE